MGLLVGFLVFRRVERWGEEADQIDLLWGVSAMLLLPQSLFVLVSFA